MVRSFFICGTDTGVGKTIVTGALCAWLNNGGVKAGAFKPAESGCQKTGRHFKRADSEFLKKMAGMKEPLDEINPYFFKEPLAPGIAANRENKKISFSKIKKSHDKLLKKYDVLFVEGAGGLLVPLSGQKTNLDLIRHLDIPVIIVGRLGLGTINHTLLTLYHLESKKIKVSGIILNEITKSKSISEKTNPSILQKEVSLWGVFPYLKSKTKKELIKAASGVGRSLFKE